MVLSFIAFCGLMTLALYGGKWFLLDSDVSQEASATLISGNVTLAQPGSDQSIVLAQPREDVGEGWQIETGGGAQAAIEFRAPKGTVLGGMQLYGSSRATLALLRSPRFEWSGRSHRIIIDLQRGRARVNLTAEDSQFINISLRTRHAWVELLQPGSYSVEITDKGTEVAVREGVAAVLGQEQSVNLSPDQRTFVPDGGAPQGILTGESNLIRNGDFAQGLAPDWTVYQNLTQGDAQGEITRQKDREGRDVLTFFRPGTNWGQVGIRQVINRDIRDYESLRLHLAVRLSSQNVLSCGQYGSECPLMAKIEYTDKAGGQREWIQGFYYLPGARLPTVCVTCPPPQTEHLRVERNVWLFYESSDLIKLLNEPAIINALSIEAQGHAFESFVSEVELLAGD